MESAISNLPSILACSPTTVRRVRAWVGLPLSCVCGPGGFCAVFRPGLRFLLGWPPCEQAPRRETPTENTSGKGNRSTAGFAGRPILALIPTGCQPHNSGEGKASVSSDGIGGFSNGPRMERIRPPAVAGQFYPDDPEALRAEVMRSLEPEAPRTDALAIVVPHAGLVYSGRVAGAVYSRVRLPGTARPLG